MSVAHQTGGSASASLAAAMFAELSATAIWPLYADTERYAAAEAQRQADLEAEAKQLENAAAAAMPADAPDTMTDVESAAADDARKEETSQKRPAKYDTLRPTRAPRSM